MWVASFCRITSVVEEMDESGDFTRFGFSYGTLNEHVVKGILYYNELFYNV